MNAVIKKNNQNVLEILRDFNYAPYVNRQGDSSYVRRVHGSEFPRFHLYINKEDNESLYCAVHLDQKRPSYAGSHAHGGDYDSEVVVAEVARLQSSRR